MTPEYRAEKEASVSYLGGGGIWEINAVTFIAPVRDTRQIVAACILMDMARPPLSYGLSCKPGRASSSLTHCQHVSRTFCYIVERSFSRLLSTQVVPKSSSA